MLTPVKTVPYFCEKDWGGTRLRTLFQKPITGAHIGESWEVSAHPSGECSAWGLPLSRAVAQYGKELLGKATAPFPLLVKLLDAQENLSVQIHPDDFLASSLEGQPYGKTEAWVVLDAPPNAQLILGTNCDAPTLRAAIARGDMESCLTRLPVKKGDALFIPAGTVHALTQGIVVYEVQQSSDTTYRLYAWGRDAQLHIDKSLRAMELPAHGAGLQTPQRIDAHTQRLVSCHAFTLDRVSPGDGLDIACDGSRFCCYTAMAAGTLTHDTGTIHYALGESLLIPAATRRYALKGGELLRATPVLLGEG